MKTSRAIAIAYGSVVGASSLWAWYIDAKLLHSPREHLLPDMLLGFLSLPMSLSLGPLYDMWPQLLSKPFAQLAWLTLCGAGQVAILFFASQFLGEKREE